MLDNNKTNTDTYSAVAIMVAITAASSGGLILKNPSDVELLSNSVSVASGYNKALETSGDTILFYDHASDVFSAAKNEEGPADIGSIKMQLRNQLIVRSFSKHSMGFPVDKTPYVIQLANLVCKLPFSDNVLSYYNNDDETIDTVLKLIDGTTLSLSQFLNDAIDAPVVFSVHRNKSLLIADELPLMEIVQTINSVISKHNGASV